ncbi:hypothetical protein Ancab_037688 [Ancistrocladus abbreviatus]
MAVGGAAPPRGSAAAAASLRRRRTTSGAAAGGASGTMLQFYTDDAPGLKISPNVVLVMSIGFIGFVAILHVMEMAVGGAAPPRGSAAAAASLRRRRTTSGAAAGGASGTMLQFYTDDAPGLKISPNVVLGMSIGFIGFVAILHVMGKLYFVRREA